MQLQKTDRARAELKPGNRSLGQRERTLLLLADGIKSLRDFRPMFEGEGEQIALRLLKEGFLEENPGKKLQNSAARVTTLLVSETTRVTEQLRNFPSPETTQAIKVSADQFEGKRSLATTRMFLFDMCERMFARRDPAMAEHFRELLRNAKNREAMLNASRVMLEEIEKVAGHARADSISERLAMMLPVETTPDLVL